MRFRDEHEPEASLLNITVALGVAYCRGVLFNLSMGVTKRMYVRQHHPPRHLFSLLSLKSGLQTNLFIFEGLRVGE